MVSLLAKSPLDGLHLDRIGTLTLAEPVQVPVTGLAAYKGQKAALSAVLKENFGVAFPGANRMTGKSGRRLVCFGPDQALLLGPAPVDGLAAYAAVTDQSDAWARLLISGEGARDVLVRLTSADMRADIFKTGHALRTHIGHMSAVLMRSGAQTYEIMVMRSMAGTLVHEVTDAAQTVSARSG